jgi:hypothetical protein
MNLWTFWTWVSILVLTIGSFAVFVWFLYDLLHIRRDIMESERLERSRRAPPSGQ